MVQIRGGSTGSKGHNQQIMCAYTLYVSLVSLLYPSYFAVSNTSSSNVPFTNDFLGYHLADFIDLGRSRQTE